MKGIILAGGSGTRLYPLTKNTSKQLLPIYDKPMIYYPLSILMLSGIVDIAIISTPEHIESYRSLIGDGTDIGINITYIVQEYPEGLPDAFILAEEFIMNDKVCLILGDNLFYGDGFIDQHLLNNFSSNGATIFTYFVKKPSDFGILETKNNEIISIKEKPKNSNSNSAITGIYLFDENVSKYSKELSVSNRGELEIVDLIKKYYAINSLNYESLGRGVAWFDSGTPSGLLEAGKFVETIENKQGLKIACIEEIAYLKGYIDRKKFLEIINSMRSCSYKEYLENSINLKGEL